jgi:hypothetical protein
MNDLPNADITEDDDDVFTVTCVSCKSEFEGFAPEQSHDCAADVSDTGVVGYYGSTVADMIQLTFPEGKPEGLRNGQICDACIIDLKSTGILVEAGSNVAEFDTVIGDIYDLDNLTLISGPEMMEEDDLEIDDGA